MSTAFKHIVRLLGRDLDGTKTVADALSDIKGINTRLATIVVNRSNISKNSRLGFISDSEVKRIEETLNILNDINLPPWILNRRKDSNTGRNLHLTTADLELQVKEDIERSVTLKSWKGYRHAYGLKVRGQRTRTTGRKRKTVGIKKKRSTVNG